MIEKLEEKKNNLLQELVEVNVEIETLQEQLQDLEYKKEHLDTKIEVIDELIKEETPEALLPPVTL